MKFNEIPQRLGIEKKDVAESIGSTKQNLTPYWNGARFQLSDIEKRVMINYDLSREVVFFRPAFFIHSQDTPQYWLSLALEALQIAKEKGVNIDEIETQIINLGQSLEKDFEYNE